MRSLHSVLATVAGLLLLLMAAMVRASPVLLDKLFGFAAYQPSYSGGGGGGGYGGNHYGYYGGGGGGGAVSRTPKPRSKGRSYKDICRVLNPTPYALPGSIPSAGAPFCPY
uniref:Putative conserved secreted protein n=1 Tax=Culex tarsalis TaxID=7177 RepID=A0A1Q3FPM3_CULTA